MSIFFNCKIEMRYSPRNTPMCGKSWHYMISLFMKEMILASWSGVISENVVEFTSTPLSFVSCLFGRTEALLECS